MKIRIDRRLPLPDIPSASGIASTRQGLYVIGDDSPWLYRLDSAYRTVQKIRIHATEPAPDTGRISKALKADFEALAAQESAAGCVLFVFGSGSMRRTREVLSVVDTQAPGGARVYDISAYYVALCRAASIPANTLNIEAAVIFGDALYLFDRSSNVIAQCPLQALLAHLDHGASCPTPRVQRRILPSLAGRTAGFSGAAPLPADTSFLFTASVERTDDPVADGEVLGSFVGVLDPTSSGQGTVPCEVLRDAGGAVLPIKVESVTVLRRESHRRCRLLMVTDSDDGHSELLEATLDL